MEEPPRRGDQSWLFAPAAVPGLQVQGAWTGVRRTQLLRAGVRGPASFRRAALASVERASSQTELLRGPPPDPRARHSGGHVPGSPHGRRGVRRPLDL